jgi:pimeloyl-ACP methyl ester carboxylesterase
MADEGYVTAGDGVRVYFRAAGTDPRVVLVPNGMHLVDEFARLARDRTLVFADLRNRGRSDAQSAAEGRGLGVRQDVEDMRAIAIHLGAESVDVIGHSVQGLIAGVFAMTYPSHVSRVVQIGPMAANPDTEYPAGLSNRDAVFAQVMNALATLQAERANHEPEAFCRMVWAVLNPLYVTDPANADRIRWSRCELPNERGAMRYFMEHTMPSIRALNLTAEQFARVTAPVLIVHGNLDRSAPYGGGREWALRLPNARLLTVTGAGHAPWIEAPDLVFRAIDVFLRGAWPAEAEQVAPTRFTA